MQYNFISDYINSKRGRSYDFQLNVHIFEYQKVDRWETKATLETRIHVLMFIITLELESTKTN